MAEQITDTAFELIISESYAGEIECESKHKRVPVCSHDVTHAVTDCKITTRQCQNAVNATKAFMDTGKNCIKCHRPARDCWSIRPI